MDGFFRRSFKKISRDSRKQKVLAKKDTTRNEGIENQIHMFFIKKGKQTLTPLIPSVAYMPSWNRSIFFEIIQ